MRAARAEGSVSLTVWSPVWDQQPRLTGGLAVCRGAPVGIARGGALGSSGTRAEVQESSSMRICKHPGLGAMCFCINKCRETLYTPLEEDLPGVLNIHGPPAAQDGAK